MKKLLVLLTFLTLGFTAFAQNPIQFKYKYGTTNTNINGMPINRGDEFDIIVDANGNGNTTTRQLLFDFQYDQNNFEVVSINHTGTGGNGGVLPGGSNIQLSWTNYPNYTYGGNTTNTNGTTRYSTGISYQYQNGGPNAILRATLTWATSSGMPYGGFDRLIIVRFRLKTSSTAYTFNPIKLNFVAGWNANGQYDNTFLSTPLSNTVNMNQNVGKLVTAKVDVNSNLLALTNLKVSFRDIATNQGALFNVNSDGTVDINQSQLQENKTYDVTVMHEMDKMYNTYNNAITLSDFTTAQNEFTTMGLDGSNGQILKTGQSLYAADINRNKTIDGGDLPQLLAQVIGLDTLFTLPSQYNVGSNGFMSLPTWRSTDATTTAGQVEWGVLYLNTYGQGVSKVDIDMREFTGTGVNPDQIKSLQLFDLYSGPVEYVSQNGTWATYKVPSNFNTIATSTYPGFIRDAGSNTFGLRAEFEFSADPSKSWGSITSTNWKDITNPKVTITTGILGTNTVLDLKYLLWGDVNRSHSSQVVAIDNNGSILIKTSALSSLATNSAFNNSAVMEFINTPNNISAIDVNLSNLTVTSNAIEIPITINTNNNKVAGVQFEFTYDATKIKFDELKSELPNTWFIFAHSKDGKVKFGALDQNAKTPFTGNNVPFKLKFSTIGNGVDILTSIKVTKTMDASDDKGNQLGITLNSTQIKLTGYNNFNK
jgi:hypothetical protein